MATWKSEFQEFVLGFSFYMKGLLDRTKVVLRHLPPTISQSNLVEHIDSRFSGRYGWLAFRPGKSSTKHLTHSRAYIDFIRPEDVIEFAEFFNGHVFVNEKGSQFKAIVEYAPSQRIPKQWSKKDGREGTVFKDHEYLEFLEFLAKPVENLPSAEIQLEKKEAERAGAPKNVPIVTPLMEYVRQKRVAKFGARRTVVNGKSSRKVGGISSKSPVSGSLKRGSEKRTSTMYVLKDSSKGFGGKDKPTFLVVSKHDDQLADKSDISASVSRDAAPERDSGGSGSTGIVKKKILLLKAKETSNERLLSCDATSLCFFALEVDRGANKLYDFLVWLVYEKRGKTNEVLFSVCSSQDALISSENSHSSATFRNNQQRDTKGRIVRSILLNKDPHQNQPSLGSQRELRTPALNQDRDKKLPRPPISQLLHKETNVFPEDKAAINDSHAVRTEKKERRTKNRDRPDRGVWTPIRRSEGSHASDDSLSSSASQTSQVVDSAEDAKNEISVTRGGNYRHNGSGRNSHYSVQNGYRNGGCRGSAYNVKDASGSSVVEGKPLKHGASSGYGTHEKQVWVQKSSSGS
ncbi:Smg-4/UPF3 family protein [Striga asiatica]|uniref:Smg-4/UPF3 family protein n=1 Tax=Striga asiatica TaxID=4170 RepID=A0A5A7QKP5_STRAF|nr:Smg-4/UPF3 family protein [Striga asiatica]